MLKLFKVKQAEYLCVLQLDALAKIGPLVRAERRCGLTDAMTTTNCIFGPLP